MKPKNNRDLNQGVLHLWSKFGDCSLSGWQLIVRTNWWLTDTHTYIHTRPHRQTQATTIPEGHNWPRVIKPPLGWLISTIDFYILVRRHHYIKSTPLVLPTKQWGNHHKSQWCHLVQWPLYINTVFTITSLSLQLRRIYIFIYIYHKWLMIQMYLGKYGSRVFKGSTLQLSRYISDVSAFPCIRQWLSFVYKLKCFRYGEFIIVYVYGCDIIGKIGMWFFCAYEGYSHLLHRDYNHCLRCSFVWELRLVIIYRIL